jgi:hypothetical protein
VFSNREKGVHITAELGSDGSYELQMARGFGLPLGTYQVAVNPPLREPQMPGMPNIANQPRIVVPPKYLRPETSGLTLTVVDGDNPYNIDMK